MNGLLALGPISPIFTPALAPSGPAQFLPTSVCLREFAEAVCLSLLGNTSSDADAIFNAARLHAPGLFLPNGARIIRTKSLDEISGLNINGRELRIGRREAISAWLDAQGDVLSPLASQALMMLAMQGRDALIVADARGDLGVIGLNR